LSNTLHSLVKSNVNAMLVDPNVLEMPFAEWMRPGAAPGGRGKPMSMRPDGKQIEYGMYDNDGRFMLLPSS